MFQALELSLWSLTAFLSIMLGFLNLLPIPALDGGHVVFLLFEMVSGKAMKSFRTCTNGWILHPHRVSSFCQWERYFQGDFN